MDQKWKIMIFFFSFIIDFLNTLIDLVLLIPILSLFHSFIWYGKNVLLKDFVSVGTGPIIEADDDINE